MREYFYFDTNVYRDVVEENWHAEEALLRRHKKRLKLATTTVLELLEDLDTRSPTKFATAQRALQLARDTAGQTILPVREDFLASRLFRTEYRSGQLGSAQIRRWVDVAIRYRTIAHVGSLIRVGPIRVPMALDIGAIRHAQEEFRSRHVRMIGGYRSDILKTAGVTSLPPVGGPLSGNDAAKVTRFFEGQQWRRHYVKMWANALGRSGLTEEQLDNLWPSMQPAGEFLSRVLLQSLRDGYNFERNSNDVTDEAHLSYLCDPLLTFVTQDKRLRSKLSASSLSRVISFDAFKKRLGR